MVKAGWTFSSIWHSFFSFIYCLIEVWIHESTNSKCKPLGQVKHKSIIYYYGNNLKITIWKYRCCGKKPHLYILNAYNSFNPNDVGGLMKPTQVSFSLCKWGWKCQLFWVFLIPIFSISICFLSLVPSSSISFFPSIITLHQWPPTPPTQSARLGQFVKL